MNMKKAIICFTRIPKPGKTKTRLLPVLSGEDCVGLHTAFLRDLSEMLKVYALPCYIYYTNLDEPSELQVLKDIFPFAAGFLPQIGEDLGEKMHNALLRVLSLGYDACLLTGSDLPLMAARHLDSGFKALETADVTLGPTDDGGYYLVGLKKACYELFSNQKYGGGSVYESALKAISHSGQSFAQALPCSDVDTPEDLMELIKLIDPNSFTAAFLRDINVIRGEENVG